jgi:DNA mismatch endonuclease, patch repair protein
MADNLSPSARSRIMSLIRGKDTKPEKVVRSIAHRLGYRFRLHRRDLPGTPDMVFPKLRKVIFVHGCFWHMHSCSRGRSTPVSNAAFWSRKRSVNTARDRLAVAKLRRSGWRVLTLWECQVKDRQKLTRRLATFLAG